MIALTYALSGVLLAVTGELFRCGAARRRRRRRLAWTVDLLLRLGGGERRLSDGRRDASRSRCAR